VRELDTVKEISSKILDASGEDAVKYKTAAEQGLDALGKAMSLLEGIRDGDSVGVQVALTEFEEVNRTLEAIGKMDKAIEDAESSVELQDVLDVVKAVVTVAVTIATVL
jgi:hypothetical protein